MQQICEILGCERFQRWKAKAEYINDYGLLNK
jgi:hypothetical protein